MLPVFHAFDRAESPVIHYISAWQGNEKNIWYEFVSQQFLDLMGCDNPTQVADIFRKTIIDRRIYKFQGIDDFIVLELLGTLFRIGLGPTSQVRMYALKPGLEFLFFMLQSISNLGVSCARHRVLLNVTGGSIKSNFAEIRN